MKRVLHLVEYLEQGGIERLLHQIALHTPQQSAKLFFFAYQTKTLSGIGREIRALNVPLYLYDKRPGYDFALLKELSAVVKCEQITTIHTHDFGPMEYAVALKLRHPHLQLVHTHHTLHYFFSIRHYRYLFQFFGWFFDRILCVSDHVRKQLASACPLVRKKLVTVYNGVDLIAFKTKPRPRIFSPLRMVSICRISPEKNLFHLLKTFERLKRKGINFEWHHAGSGPAELETSLKAFVLEHGLKSNVFFHGFQHDVRPILELGDIFLSSSITEGHPIAILEAMAARKLVICSDIPAHRNLTNHSILFFDLNVASLSNLLEKISRQPEEFLELPHQALCEVKERFSIQNMIENYLKIYKN